MELLHTSLPYFGRTPGKIKYLDLGPLTASEKATSIPLAHSYKGQAWCKEMHWKKGYLKRISDSCLNWVPRFMVMLSYMYIYLLVIWPYKL